MNELPDDEETEMSLSLESMNEPMMHGFRLMVILVKDHLTAFHHPLMVKVVESGLLPIQEMLDLYLKLHRHTDAEPETLMLNDILLLYTCADLCGKLMISSLGDRFLEAWQIRNMLDGQEATVLRNGLSTETQNLVQFLNEEMKDEPVFTRLQHRLITEFSHELLD